MTAFGAYARYYDLIYRDKDYTGEVRYILNLLGACPGTILDLGCGTGRHALCLAGEGPRVVGVDCSEEMIAAARANAGKAPDDVRTRVGFQLGDIRRLDLGRRFDAVISLFHVMSYQVEAEDVTAAVRSASRHLEVGGWFVFDFWHGPGVLNLGPERRERTFTDGRLVIRRCVEPMMWPDRHRVDLDVRLDVHEASSGTSACICERHSMRYFFHRELETWLGQAGMMMRFCRAWMTDREPDVRDWSACCAAEKVP